MIDLPVYKDHLSTLETHTGLWLTENSRVVKLDRKGNHNYRINDIDIVQPMKPVIISADDVITFSSNKQEPSSYVLSNGENVSVEKHREMEKTLNCRIPVTKTYYKDAVFYPLEINMVGTLKPLNYSEEWVEPAIQYGRNFTDTEKRTWSYRVNTKNIIIDISNELLKDKSSYRVSKNDATYKDESIFNHLAYRAGLADNFKLNTSGKDAVIEWYTDDVDEVGRFIEYIRSAIQAYIEKLDSLYECPLTLNEISKVISGLHYDDDTDVIDHLYHYIKRKNGNL